MEYGKLGDTDLRPSVIGFGCNLLGLERGREQIREAVSTIEMAVERGINLFDTANNYGYGESERILGKVLRGRRDRVILCSKAGNRHWGTLLIERALGPLGRPFRCWLGRQYKTTWNYRPRFLEMAIEASLRSLGTDYLDLFYLHAPPLPVIRDGAVFDTLARLRQRGWIRYYGVSHGRGSAIQTALASLDHPGVSVAQVPVGAALIIDLERLRAAMGARNIGLVGNAPFLKGAALSAPHLREALAARPGYSAAQTALRFALQTPGIDTVLAGMRTRWHLGENLAALEAPALSPDEVDRLKALARVV